MTSISAGRSRPGLLFQAAGTLLVGVLAALSWVAWMGWDQQYQTDAAGNVSGPYETWQVVGCAGSLLALFVGALLAGVRPVPASAALVLAFTVAWTVQAAAEDETGMYGVGTVLLLIGLTAATAVVAAVTLAVRNRWSARRRRG